MSALRHPVKGLGRSLRGRTRCVTLPLPFQAPDHPEPPTLPSEQGQGQPTVAAPTVLPSTTAEPTLGQRALVAQLAREVQRIEISRRVSQTTLDQPGLVISTGCAVLDGCLPEGGYQAGTVVEYLQTSSAGGGLCLALTAAREALAATDRYCLFVDWRKQFYPPAAVSLGIDLKRLVIVRPRSLADRLWAIDQALRSPAIVAVVAEVEHLDDRAGRRLQLAAERGGGLGLLVRGFHSRLAPSWSEVQWVVRPVPERTVERQLELQLVRARGGGQRDTRVRIQFHNVQGWVAASPRRSVSAVSAPCMTTGAPIATLPAAATVLAAHLAQPVLRQSAQPRASQA